jgi:uncharacterized protein YjbI with pentapeptide repeats
MPINSARPPRVNDAVKAATYVLGQLPAAAGALRFVDDYLVGANFVGAKSLKDADFEGAQLSATSFTWAHPVHAKFSGAAMSDWKSYGWADGAWAARMDAARAGADSTLWSSERFNYLINFDHAVLTKTQFERMSIAGASFDSPR